MSFLAPLFFAGLAALAIPVFIHLIQRERKRVVLFPSLMFVRRIPYQSVRRRRIRNWLLLLVRLTAILLIVAAFARPFFRQSQIAAAASGGAREVVILLDGSYSMGYGDRWDRARAEAREAVSALGAADRASIVLFATEPEVLLRSTGDRSRLLAAIESAALTASATRYGPALKLAGSILAESQLPRREAILVTDFQRSGWQGVEGLRLPDGATLTPERIDNKETANLSITPVSLQRSTFEKQERVVVTAGVINRSSRPVTAVDVILEVGGRAVQTERPKVDANGSASVTFAPLTIEPAGMRGTVRLAADALTPDNAFHFVLSPADAVRILLVEREGAAAGTSLYLTRALSIGEAPRFDVAARRSATVGDDDVRARAVVVLNDIAVTPQLAARLGSFVESGGGLFVVLGERAAWTSSGPELLPGIPAGFVDRSKGEVGRMGALQYGHPVFEPFRAARTGDFSAARFYGYRALTGLRAAPAREAAPAGDAGTGRAPATRPLQPDSTRPQPEAAPEQAGNPSAEILARFDDGAPALVERRVGRGRVLVWTSSLDLSWNDLALKPVFLPFVHRVVRHLSGFAEPAPWHTVGQVVDASNPGATSHDTRGAQLVVSPSGRRVAQDGEGPDVLVLTEQGFYEIRSEKGGTQPSITVASNVDLSESDLTGIDPREIVSAVTGPGAGTRDAGSGMPLTPEAQERMQRVWWYLLLGGITLLGIETVLSNRLSRTVSS